MTAEIKQRIEQIRRGEVPEGYQQVNGYVIPEGWHLVAFSKKFKRLLRCNTTACNNVLTISAQLGLVSQKEYYDKDIASEDKSGYFLLQHGEFAYNKSYSSGYPYGAIKRLEKYEEGIVSPLYICFEPKQETNADFYSHYFEAGLYNREIYRFAQEGARNHGLLNISTEDFFDGTLIVPPEEEQRKMAEILATCDRVIGSKQKLVDELNKLKKVCLEKMFPQKGSSVPEIRFPGFTAPWRRYKLGEIADSFSGGTPTAGKSEYYGGSIPFIRSAEINSDTTEFFLTEEGLRNSSAKMVKKGDILYALYGATSGEVGVAKIDGAINQAILDIRPHESFDSFFIMQWLRKSRESIVGTYLQGGQGNLSGTIVTSLMIECPDHNEQKRIGAFFTNLDDLITLHQRGLEAEQQKKKALVQLLLTGFVRV
ncbi:MAG: restriction endonuclease subunit S [Clostridia bacterium]|nr:restriction endonuclease subunit S [Clostridia bacterium]